MPDKDLDGTIIDHLLDTADKPAKAMEALFEGIPGREVDAEEAQFLREMARNLITASLKSLRLAKSILDSNQENLKTNPETPIKMSQLYQAVLMPAQKVDFPDEVNKVKPILIRHGRELRGHGHVMQLSSKERAFLTILLHHPHQPLSRKVFEAFGFAEDMSGPGRQVCFSTTKIDLAVKLRRLNGERDGIVRGPNDGHCHTYLLSDLSFVCGAGTEVIATEKLLADLPTYMPGEVTPQELHTIEVVDTKRELAVPIVPRVSSRPSTITRNLEPNLERYGPVNNAPSSKELLRQMKRRNSMGRGASFR